MLWDAPVRKEHGSTYCISSSIRNCWKWQRSKTNRCVRVCTAHYTAASLNVQQCTYSTTCREERINKMITIYINERVKTCSTGSEQITVLQLEVELGGIIAIQCCTRADVQIWKAVVSPPRSMSLSQTVSCSLQWLNKTKRQTNPPGTHRQRKYFGVVLCLILSSLVSSKWHFCLSFTLKLWEA